MKAVEVLKRRPVVALLAFVLLGGSAIAGRKLLRDKSVLVGAVVKPLTLPIVANISAGAQVSVPNPAKRIVVLDMFETTCGPCKKSLPRAQYRFDAEVDVQFVAVCLDEDRSAAERVAAEWGLKKEVAWDEKGEARRQFNVVGIPATVIIAPNGLITGNFGGYEPSEADLNRALTDARNAI